MTFVLTGASDPGNEGKSYRDPANGPTAKRPFVTALAIVRPASVRPIVAVHENVAILNEYT
jgi:hypothetical protein